MTLGYVIAVAIFFPLGRGHLKENVNFQVFAFVFFLIVTVLFFKEFIFSTGLNYSVPMIGPDVGQLVGVVLFNYAFAVTVPAWLNEKKSHVSVNWTIWCATSVLTAVYIGFGILGSMAFAAPPTDMLSMLGSKKSEPITRVCAALFGVIIIGCGVPIYCVLIKNTLYAGRTFDLHTSFFVGAVFPYLVSWMMYQGTVMLTVLSWAGLVINGIVAFLLPLVLAIFTYSARKKSLLKVQILEDREMGCTSALVKRTPSGRILALLKSRLTTSNLTSSTLLSALDQTQTVLSQKSPQELLQPSPKVSQKVSVQDTKAKAKAGWSCLCVPSSTSQVKPLEPGGTNVIHVDHLAHVYPLLLPLPQSPVKESTIPPLPPSAVSVSPSSGESSAWDDEDLILDGSVYPLPSCIVQFQEQLIYFVLLVLFVLISGTILRNSIRAIEDLTDDYHSSQDDYTPQPNTP